MVKITEKRLYAVAPQSLTSNGTADGRLTVAFSSLFTVGQIVGLRSNTLQPIELKINRIPDSTTILLGPVDKPIQNRSDISGYTVADGAVIFANEQQRPKIPEQEIERNTYQEEPVVARRVIAVDSMGDMYGDDNPIPTKPGTEWDEADISRDGDDDITSVEFKKYGNLVETIELEYNGEKSVIKVTKS